MKKPTKKPKPTAKVRGVKCKHKHIALQNDAKQGEFLIVHCRDCEAHGYIPVNVQWIM